MENIRDFDFGKIHSLAVRLLEGTLSQAEQQELESLLLENAAARQAYLEYVQESACLRWLCVEGAEPLAEPSATPSVLLKSRRPRRFAALIVGSGLLASLLGLVVGLQFFGRSQGDAKLAGAIAKKPPAVSQPSTENLATPPKATYPIDGDGRPVVATITSANGAQWEMPAGGARVLSRLSVGDQLQLRSGSTELTFDAGVQITVFGPAEFEITSATSIRCLRGRITTLVDKRGRGFSIETPGAKVVDLGTQFGLSISDEGETEVVVFQGAVDLTPSRQPTDSGRPSRRLQQGEAMLVTNAGKFERVVAIERNSFLRSGERVVRRNAEPVIADVRDNIRGAQSAKSYQIVHGGLDDDALAFVDRSHEWNGLDEAGMPSFLAGADYIMPFNDDKFVRSLELQVTLLRPATLYLFVDNNMKVPDWIWAEFTDTGVDIGLDCAKTKWHSDHSLGVGAARSIDFKFSIWKRDIGQAGTITLGGVEPPADHTLGFNMYGIAAVAK